MGKKAKSGLFGQSREVLQKLQANSLTFFGMKLGRVNVVLPDGRREGLAIGGFGGDDGRIAWFGIEAVDEINVGVLIDAAE